MGSDTHTNRKLSQALTGLGLGDLFPNLSGGLDLVSGLLNPFDGTLLDLNGLLSGDLSTFVPFETVRGFFEGTLNFDLGQFKELDISLPWSDLVEKAQAYEHPTSVAEFKASFEKMLEQHCEPPRITVGYGEDGEEVGIVAGMPKSPLFKHPYHTGPFSQMGRMDTILEQSDVLASCYGHEFEFSVEPLTCEIDHALGEARCIPPMLVYTKTPAKCIKPVHPPIEYTGQECKISTTSGVAFEKVLGGNEVEISLGRIPKNHPFSLGFLDFQGALTQLTDFFAGDISTLLGGSNPLDLAGLFGGQV